MFYFATLATNYSLLWLGWVVGFVIIELAALYQERGKDISGYKGGTLSELIWRITRTNKLVKIIFTLFWVVLTYHFFVQ